MIAASPVEFSRPLALGELEAAGRAFSIEANAEERSAVARRLDLNALHTLRASGVVTPSVGGVRMVGRLQAEVVQTCVLSLEAFVVNIDAAFESVYRPLARDTAEAELRERDDTDVDTGVDDFCEPLEGDSIDIGEAVTQHLALELDPYPRKPGAVLPVVSDASDAERPEADASPFAVLRVRAGGDAPDEH